MAVMLVGDPESPDDYFLFVGSDNDFITQQGFIAGGPYQDASGITSIRSYWSIA
jgi:hypothetical protein